MRLQTDMTRHHLSHVLPLQARCERPQDEPSHFVGVVSDGKRRKNYLPACCGKAPHYDTICGQSGSCLHTFVARSELSDLAETAVLGGQIAEAIDSSDGAHMRQAGQRGCNVTL
jgi:hypothetical protein